MDIEDLERKLSEAEAKLARMRGELKDVIVRGLHEALDRLGDDPPKDATVFATTRYSGCSAGRPCCPKRREALPNAECIGLTGTQSCTCHRVPGDRL